MILVIDASVALKWFVDEPRRDRARGALSRDFELVAPDLLLVEGANGLRNKVRNGLAERDRMLAALTKLPDMFDRWIGARETIRDAFEIGCAINHPIADCIYLACSKLADVALLTDDATLFQKARTFDLGAKTLLLSDWTPGLPASPTG
jgi:predicted nucleic acid-binding protein